jgi:hypothetical protein
MCVCKKNCKQSCKPKQMISIDSLHSNQNNHLMADTRETVLMKGDDPTFAMNLHVSSSAAVLFCSLQVWCFFF